MLKQTAGIVLFTSIFLSAIHPSLARESQRLTLREKIKKLHLEPPEQFSLPLDAYLRSDATLDTNEEVVIAGFLFNGPPEKNQRFSDGICALKYDRKKNEWIGRALPIHNPGSVMNVKRFKSCYTIEMHHTPSANTTLIVDQTLKFHDRLPGWIETSSDSDVMIYQTSMVHFSRVHQAELYLYNPSNVKATKKIFPRTPYPPFRKKMMQRAKQAYKNAGTEWCAKKNHPCDPDRLNTILHGSVAVAPETGAVAFVIGYDKTPLDAKIDSRYVLHVYDNVQDGGSMEYREIPIDKEGKEITGEWIETWLEPEKLNELFGRKE